MQSTEANQCVWMQPPTTNCSSNSLFRLQRTGVWVITGQLRHYPNISGIRVKKNTPLWKSLVSTESTYQNNRTTWTCECEWMASCVRSRFTWVHPNGHVPVSNCSPVNQNCPYRRIALHFSNDQSSHTAPGLKNNTVARWSHRRQFTSVGSRTAIGYWITRRKKTNN